MAGLEGMVLVISIILSVLFWGKYYSEIRIEFFSEPGKIRKITKITPLFGAIILYLVLKFFSSFDVRNDSFYISFYLLFGCAWVGGMLYLSGLFGISFRDDVVERNNPSAAYTISGVIIGATLCFAGGNIGDGPGWWVVLYCAVLSSGAMFLLWVIINKLCDINEVITVDREVTAGLRHGSFFIASGLILGRAVAGNWVNESAAVRDFINTAWPVLILTFAAIIINRLAKPKPDRLTPSFETWGLYPSIFYNIFSIIYVLSLGWWK